MKQMKRWLCLFSVLVLLTLSACHSTGAEVSQQVSVPPTVGVEGSAQPSQTPAPSQEPSAQPTTQPGQNQDEEKQTSAAAATPKPTTKPTPQPTQKPAATPQPTPASKTCYLSIECKTILGRMEDLTPGKEGLVPADGVILSRHSFSFQEGETVFDVLCRATKAYGIHLEYEYTPGFGSHYIEGINNLYEFDCGAGSGWMYYVNGVKPNYGVSKYTLKDGDVIEFKYTCDLGYDL